jgi:2-polyprenyl-6-methoxyphenol hydroxylase-like FAD-dependent oxidoreductase
VHEQIYDVGIVGGGPAGATLGARIARETKLSVAIFEAEFFPRDHIGETFVHTIVPSLQESGALAKVLASECWVKKAGGVFSWDPARPWVTFFEHALHERDGHYRWSIHCNRPELDQILLEHARDSGAQVFEGTPVQKVSRADGITTLDLGAEGQARCRVFVNSSGRTGNTTITGEREFLSDYRNIAVWNHVVGGKPTQSLPGAWNIFREQNLSPVASVAFEDGWFWYIPVPKVIQGKRTMTHSLGLVTDPSAFKDPAKRFTDPEVFMKTARSVPLLGELLQEASLVSDKFLTAPNYSRISGRMCDWDKREIRIGDAAYFVDPLFSSGVHFALQHAGMALQMIKSAFDDSIAEHDKREVWEDYHDTLAAVARGFALAIDQWYTEIARDNPNSVYWKHRGGTATFDNRAETFQSLVNGQINGDLIQVITKGTNSVNSLGSEGALRRTQAEIHEREPAADARVRWRAGVAVKPSMTLEGPFRDEQGRVPSFVHGPYWDDPDAHAHEVLPLCAEPRACHRFFFADGSSDTKVKFVEAEHHGLELFELLGAGELCYGELQQRLSEPQRHLLLLTVMSDMVEIVAA